MDYILALDQGTSSSRAIVFDRQGQVQRLAQQEFRQIYPQAAWVEHDPDEIWQTQLKAAQTAAKDFSIAALGITNQRETTLIWDKATGQPIYNAIVWQDRRTSTYCDSLKAEGFDKVILEKTGLVTDAYFSATKIKWILDHVPEARQKANAGRLAFGTIDTYLIWKLTKGRLHITDVSNAARTMLFDIHKTAWSSTIAQKLDIPLDILPQVVSSSNVYGETDTEWFGKPIPIAGIAGDQQAATFGQACYEAGMAKQTYGTGAFLLLNTGEKPQASQHKLLSTIAWQIANQPVQYALEGSVFIAGAAIQWLRDELQIIKNAAETEALATSLTSNEGVYLVPAFVGLGAPYWDQYARGTIVGLTRGTGRAHLVRATLESIAYQTRDVVEAMQADSQLALSALRVDGGAVSNDFLMQFQADILGVPVQRPRVIETTALGAAYLAGLAIGFWQSQAEIQAQWHLEKQFEPRMSQDQRDTLYHSWKRAIQRAQAWLEP